MLDTIKSNKRRAIATSGISHRSLSDSESEKADETNY